MAQAHEEAIEKNDIDNFVSFTAITVSAGRLAEGMRDDPLYKDTLIADILKSSEGIFNRTTKIKMSHKTTPTMKHDTSGSACAIRLVLMRCRKTLPADNSLCHTSWCSHSGSCSGLQGDGGEAAGDQRGGTCCEYGNAADALLGRQAIGRPGHNAYR